jgi:hypothetical protein
VGLDYTRDNHLSYQSRSFASGPKFATFVPNPDNPNDDTALPEQVPLPDIRYFVFSPAGAVDTDLDGIPNFDGDDTP